jgi:hypothetical protein
MELFEDEWPLIEEGELSPEDAARFAEALRQAAAEKAKT